MAGVITGNIQCDHEFVIIDTALAESGSGSLVGRAPELGHHTDGDKLNITTAYTLKSNVIVWHYIYKCIQVLQERG